MVSVEMEEEDDARRAVHPSASDEDEEMMLRPPSLPIAARRVSSSEHTAAYDSPGSDDDDSGATSPPSPSFAMAVSAQARSAPARLVSQVTLGVLPMGSPSAEMRYRANQPLPLLHLPPPHYSVSESRCARCCSIADDGAGTSRTSSGRGRATECAMCGGEFASTTQSDDERSELARTASPRRKRTRMRKSRKCDRSSSSMTSLSTDAVSRQILLERSLSQGMVPRHASAERDDAPFPGVMVFDETAADPAVRQQLKKYRAIEGAVHDWAGGTASTSPRAAVEGEEGNARGGTRGVLQVLQSAISPSRRRHSSGNHRSRQRRRGGRASEHGGRQAQRDRERGRHPNEPFPGVMVFDESVADPRVRAQMKKNAMKGRRPSTDSMSLTSEQTSDHSVTWTSDDDRSWG